MSASGLLKETLVILMGEFGRSPQITASNAGREHWPHVFTILLAGAGIPGGRLYGSSDKHGAYPLDKKADEAEWRWYDDNASLLHCTQRYLAGYEVRITPPKGADGDNSKPFRITVWDGATEVCSFLGHAETAFTQLGDVLYVADLGFLIGEQLLVVAVRRDEARLIGGGHLRSTSTTYRSYRSYRSHGSHSSWYCCPRMLQGCADESFLAIPSPWKWISPIPIGRTCG